MTRGISPEGQDAYLEKVTKSGMEVDAAEGRDGFPDGVFDPHLLFQPLDVGGLHLRNRIVMAPMTRNMSPAGVPGADVIAYYRRRAEGGVGLIITEGTFIPHGGAGFSSNVPRFHGRDALDGWKHVVDEVHAAGAKIFPQLWHVGLMPLPGDDLDASVPTTPSGLHCPAEAVAQPSTEAELEAVIEAFGHAAASALALGFDGLQIHGAHGYLVDQFFWAGTNPADGPVRRRGPSRPQPVRA